MATVLLARIRVGVVGAAFCIGVACSSPDSRAPDDPQLSSLDELSISALREREYGSEVTVRQLVETRAGKSYLVAYGSDGLNVYSRVDIPDSDAPASGYPVVIFIHGWAGVDAAPSLDFYYSDGSNYGEMISAYVDSGFVVFAPGFRGHGTVNGIPAEGIEFLHAWDNGSYLSPVFYAVDVLNLVDGLGSFDAAHLDLKRINLVAHSQGGDVALMALAISGEGSNVVNEISAASIWSGCFPSRLTQLQTYHPMNRSPEAFLSGDGTWNGTATGANGEPNPNFVFGYPADWIGSVDPDVWTWQSDSWSAATVADALDEKLEQMYTAINAHVDNIDDAAYRIGRDENGKVQITHDPRVLEGLRMIGAFDNEEFLTESLALQFSDRDFYSLPAWNHDLCERVSAANGHCQAFEYAENTHSLSVSQHRWFSSENAIAGFETALRRDIEFFQ